MFKVVIVFLLVMLILAMGASALMRALRGPDAGPRLSDRFRRPLDKSQTRAKCGHCGRPVEGTAPCVCGKG